ncbi:FeS-binding protein [Desulfuromonas soudanensis]|uniref:FeS-binding protein n=1 Tax=Desulfuromonas soudanensis TaxID=1603606 RepID=A0A0M3QGN1_9BACT|nr:4Fe-4S binding protein [Desulfuromonas soudanensis]ALC18093.1 FeS-binding protein [Desulfuromonas soudanensis]
MPESPIKIHFFRRHRTPLLLLGVLLFMPPLSLLFQAGTTDSNFCGAWCPRMFFVWREGMTFSQFFLGFARSFMGVILLVGILLSTLFLGRYWCSHLCPIGGTTELGSRLVSRRLKIDYSPVPAPPVRYGYLAVYLLAPLAGLGSLCCNYCNFATVPRLYGAFFTPADLAYFFRTLGWLNLALVVFLGFLARGGRGYCNFFCPVGALDALAAKLGSRFGRRMRLDAERCTRCGLCLEVCPTWAIGLEKQPCIDQLSCLPCGECEKVCPENAIAYKKAAARGRLGRRAETPATAVASSMPGACGGPGL